MDVRKQATKCKRIRARAVQWVKDHYRGAPIPGVKVADAVKVEIIAEGMLTSGEVVAKELRAAVRAGQLRKSYTTTNGTRLVQYSPADAGAISQGAPSAHPRDGTAPPGSHTSNTADNHEQTYDTTGQGLLLDQDEMNAKYWDRG